MSNYFTKVILQNEKSERNEFIMMSNYFTKVISQNEQNDQNEIILYV
jgi:hypothetical protein